MLSVSHEWNEIERKLFWTPGCDSQGEKGELDPWLSRVQEAVFLEEVWGLPWGSSG